MSHFKLQKNETLITKTVEQISNYFYRCFQRYNSASHCYSFTTQSWVITAKPEQCCIDWHVICKPPNISRFARLQNVRTCNHMSMSDNVQLMIDNWSVYLQRLIHSKVNLSEINTYGKSSQTQVALMEDLSVFTYFNRFTNVLWIKYINAESFCLHVNYCIFETMNAAGIDGFHSTLPCIENNKTQFTKCSAVTGANFSSCHELLPGPVGTSWRSSPPRWVNVASARLRHLWSSVGETHEMT